MQGYILKREDNSNVLGTNQLETDENFNLKEARMLLYKENNNCRTLIEFAVIYISNYQTDYFKNKTTFHLIRHKSECLVWQKMIPSIH